MSPEGWVCFAVPTLLGLLGLLSAIAAWRGDRPAEGPGRARYVGRARVPDRPELELDQAVDAAQELYLFYRVTGWLPGEYDYRNHPMGDTPQ